jgi:hypothetical protein
VKWHSVVAGIVAIVCGLPLTGLLFLGFRASWKGNDDSGAPVETRRDDGWRNIPITLIDSLHTSLNFAHHQRSSQFQHEISISSAAAAAAQNQRGSSSAQRQLSMKSTSQQPSPASAPAQRERSERAYLFTQAL